MDDEFLDAWLTRRALTEGIERARVRVSPFGRPFVIRDGDGQPYVLGKTAHLDRARAVATAEAERARQILALEQRIARLRALDFADEV